MSCSPDWPHTCYIAKDDLEILTILSASPQYRDNKGTPPHLALNLSSLIFFLNLMSEEEVDQKPVFPDSSMFIMIHLNSAMSECS